MIEIKANSLKQIPLGRMGENLARKIVFDISAWIDIYGDGHAVLIHQRPQDAIPFPIAIEQHETEVWWPVTRTDTASSIGIGQCELQYYVGDTLVKSKSFKTFVEDAMDEPSEEEPPAPEQGWVAQIVAIGLEAKISADAANTDAKIVKVLKEEVAQNASQVAQNTSDTANAKEAAETAKRLAEDAQLAAETAQKAAEDVQSAVAKFATDADAAKQAAEAALKATQDAAAAAAKALADIRALYQQMQTWAQGVIQDVNDAGSVAVRSVQTAGDTQVQRVTDEGTTQTANAKAQADDAKLYADEAKQSATDAHTAKTAAETAMDAAVTAQSKADAAQKGAEDAKSEAKASEEASASNAATAMLSAQNAKDSEDAAKASEDNAAQSATDAQAAMTAAQASQSGAEAAQSAAAQSAQEAAGSASAASTSETNAKASEVSAKASETAAQASQTASAGSASAAANSAASASASASASSESAAAAAASETTAKASEEAAKASETAAKASETAAAGSASAAQQSATSAAESAAVYDDVVANVTQLKADFDAVVTKTPVSRNLANPAEYITGKIMGITGALADSSHSFVMGAIRVVSGEKIYLTLPRTINCFDANGSNIQSLYYKVNPNTWSNEYTVPDGVASIVITGYNSRLPYMVNRGTELLPYEAYSDDVEYEVKPAVLPEIPVEKVPDINVDKIIGFREDSILPFVYEPEYTMSKGYMTANGSITETENHKHTSKISVNAGDVISIVSPKKAPLRFVCAFDENDNAIYSSGSMNQIYCYTVPDGITSIVLSIENKYEGYYKVLITTNRNVSGAKYVSKTELSNNSIAVVKNKIAPKLHDKVSGVVNSETGMKINACCCQNKTIMFRGNISSISDIVIGLGHNGAREIFYKIDSTKVTLYTSASGNPVVEVEHGLAISGYICVTINANDANAKITVATMSGVFTHETNAWIKNPAEVFVETDSGSVLTDCELIFSPNDICKSIWLFGDSYMSYADNRVLYWLKNLGATNFCINALPGEASDRAMTDLMYMLEYSTPSKIIWNMGMNDGDKNGAVNANWETCFNLLKAICGEKGIELILYTVPSVPTVDNEYKNAVIHDSGYRYIDGASAVGASASGVWNEGMLSDDGVHPNTTGAIAIAQEMILTVPELLLN